MIEQIEAASQLEAWKFRDIFSIRILSLLKSYGTKYNFVSFYRQVIDGQITAIFSKLDNNVTLALGDDFDNDELTQFFCITGHGSILCPPDFQLGLRYEEGAIMKCTSKRDVSMSNVTIDEYPKLMDLYNFVDYENQDFKAWYVDVSHRVRHNTAKAYTLNIGDDIISSGILSSIYEGYAILTGVRTGDEFRRMGYGGYLVSSICNDVKGTVYIMRDMNQNESFYTNIGFKNIGIWRMYK